MGVIIKIDMREMDQGLAELLSRIKDPAAALKRVGVLVQESVRENFRAGGRPYKWQLSRRARKERGQTLRDTNRLMNSITSKVDRGMVIVGTNVKYAVTHQLGAKKGSFGTVVARVKAHKRRGGSGKFHTVMEHTRKVSLPWGDIPPRPFLLVQQADWPGIREIITNYVVMGK